MTDVFIFHKIRFLLFSPSIICRRMHLLEVDFNYDISIKIWSDGYGYVITAAGRIKFML